MWLGRLCPGRNLRVDKGSLWPLCLLPSLLGMQPLLSLPVPWNLCPGSATMRWTDHWTGAASMESTQCGTGSLCECTLPPPFSSPPQPPLWFPSWGQASSPAKLVFFWFVVQSLSHVQFFGTPWTAACQASLSFIISWSLPKLVSIESMMPCNHLILCFPSPPSLDLSQHQGLFKLFASSGQSIRASASASVLPMNFQG